MPVGPIRQMKAAVSVPPFSLHNQGSFNKQTGHEQENRVASRSTTKQNYQVSSWQKKRVYKLCSPGSPKHPSLPSLCPVDAHVWSSLLWSTSKFDLIHRRVSFIWYVWSTSACQTTSLTSCLCRFLFFSLAHHDHRPLPAIIQSRYVGFPLFLYALWLIYIIRSLSGAPDPQVNLAMSPYI